MDKGKRENVGLKIDGKHVFLSVSAETAEKVKKDEVFRASFYQQVAAAYKKGKLQTVEKKGMSTTATGATSVNQVVGGGPVTESASTSSSKTVDLPVVQPTSNRPTADGSTNTAEPSCSNHKVSKNAKSQEGNTESNAIQLEKNSRPPGLDGSQHSRGGSQQHGRGGSQQHGRGGSQQHGRGGSQQHGRGGSQQHGRGGSQQLDRGDSQRVGGSQRGRGVTQRGRGVNQNSRGGTQRVSCEGGSNNGVDAQCSDEQEIEERDLEDQFPDDENDYEENGYFTHNRILFLIETYRKFQKKFENVSQRKYKTWREVAAYMEANGFAGVTGRMCEQKFKNMKATYMKSKAAREKTGAEGGSKWPYYDLMDSLLRKNHAVNPDNILEAGACGFNKIRRKKMFQDDESSEDDFMVKRRKRISNAETIEMILKSEAERERTNVQMLEILSGFRQQNEEKLSLMKEMWGAPTKPPSPSPWNVD